MVAVIIALMLISAPTYAESIKATVSANVAAVETAEQAAAGQYADCVNDGEMMVCK